MDLVQICELGERVRLQRCTPLNALRALGGFDLSLLDPHLNRSYRGTESVGQ